jgi:tape measure domain-containing protein
MTDTVLVLRLRGDASQLVGEIRNAAGQARTFSTQAADSGQAAARGFDQARESAGRMREGINEATTAVRNLVAGVGIARLARGFLELGDATANMRARIALTTDSLAEQSEVQRQLFGISQRTSSALQNNVELYSRLALALRDQNVPQREMLALTETINQTFALSGATTAEQASATLQLSQAFAAGALRGEEFNAVNEAAPRLMQAVAAQLGVSRGELKKLAEEGAITADVLRAALSGDQADQIASEFSKLPVTAERAFEQVRNSVAVLLGDSAAGVGQTLSEVLQFTADLIANAKGYIARAIGEIHAFWEGMKGGALAIFIELDLEIQRILDQIVAGFGGQLRELGTLLAALPSETVSQLGLDLQDAGAAMQVTSDRTRELEGYLAATRAETEANVAAIRENASGLEAWYREQVAVGGQIRATTTAVAAGTGATKDDNAAKKEATRLAKDWAAADRELERQRNALLDQWAEEAIARRELRTLIRDIDQELDNEQRLASLSGKAHEEAENAIRAEAIAREINNASIEAGRVLTVEEIEFIRSSTEARLNAIDAVRAQTEANDEAVRENEQTWRSFYENLADVGAAFITRQIDSVSDLAAEVRAIFQRLAFDLVRQRIVVPILAQIVGGGSGGLGAASGLAGAARGASGLGNLGALLPGLGGFSAGAGVFSAAAGATGSIFGGLSAATSFGFSSLAAGNIGVGLGALAGPIGIALAAIGALRALFASDKPPDIRLGGSGARVRSQEGTIAGSPFGDIRAGSRGISYQQFGAEIVRFDQGIADLVASLNGGQQQLDAIRDRLRTWSVDLRGSAATVENVLGSRFEAILSTFPQDIQQLVRGAGDFQAQVQRLGEVLRGQAELASLIQGLELEDQLATMSEIERQQFLINKQFDEYVAQAIAVGATQEQLARLEELRQVRLDRLAQSTRRVAEAEDELIDLRIGQAGRDPSGLVGEGPLQPWDAATRQPIPVGQFDPGTPPGDGYAWVPGLGWVAPPNYAANDPTGGFDINGAIRGLRDWLGAQRLGPNSSLTARARFDEANRQFRELLLNAQRDPSQIANLSNAAQQALDLARPVLGDSQEFVDFERGVRESLEPLARLADTNAQQAQVLLSLSESIRRLNELLAEIARRDAADNPKVAALVSQIERSNDRLIAEKKRYLDAQARRA